MKTTIRSACCLALLTSLFAATIADVGHGAYLVESLTGEVTMNEIDTFIAEISNDPIPTSQWKKPDGSITHDWLSTGDGGYSLHAINRMYQTTREVSGTTSERMQLLNLAIKWSDLWLSHRNDQPGGDHRTMWTGNVDPVWPPRSPTDAEAKYAGCENGEVVGILAYTAFNIANTPSIWNNTIPDGNPNGYGATYIARCRTYVSLLEKSMDNYFNKYFLDTTALMIKRPTSTAYNTPAPGENVNAWNRMMMFMFAYQMLGQCHDVLRDDSSKATMYRTIVKNTTDLFAQNAVPHSAADGSGITVNDWGYGNYGDVLNNLSNETLGIHGEFDIWGLGRAYWAGYTDVTSSQMTRYADTVVHEIQMLPDSPGVYAKTVNRSKNTLGTQDWLAAGYYLLSPFRSTLFPNAANATIAHGLNPQLTASILWAKHWNHISGGVRFYTSINYGGSTGKPLPKGTYTMQQLQNMGINNDSASSVRIPPGWTVIIYSDNNFSGSSWTRTIDTSDFTTISGLNDAMSSVRIE